MQTAFCYALFIAGLIMLMKGSDWFTEASLWFARMSGIPQILLGATLVSFCTTIPETFICAIASLREDPGMVIGTALGSIAFNAGFVLGMLVLLARPKVTDRKSYGKTGLLLICAMVFVWLCGVLQGEIGRGAGLILVLLLFLYLGRNAFLAQKSVASGKAKRTKPDTQATAFMLWQNIFLFLAGLVLVLFGARLVVDSGMRIAALLDIPSVLIAVIFTALGASLPELTTSIASIRKGAAGLAIGNLLGANILNLLMAIGVSALISPIPFVESKNVLLVEFPLTLAIAAAAVLLGVLPPKRFPRWTGFLLFFLYFIFILVNILGENTPLFGILF